MGKTRLKLVILLSIIVLGGIGPWLVARDSVSESRNPNHESRNNLITEKDKRNMYRKLTREEERVIVKKGTEAPFTGEYDKFFEKGVYTCRRCGAELFESDNKFASECGWPSFDEQIPGAVKWTPDRDGIRTEITCTNCRGHLGHVFLGEGYTAKNTRYCVNSISMIFIPAEKRIRTEKAIFASGCFWGTEYFMQKEPGVISTTVGYTGGHVDYPTYAQVCTGTTGHAESVQVIYDPNKTSYEKLAKLFFETHDFSQVNGQGPDIGPQYRSAIFCLNNNQKETAIKLVNILREKGKKVATEPRSVQVSPASYALQVATEITPAGRFWPAEEYHQQYYDKNGKRPYCHTYRKIFDDEPVAEKILNSNI